jgi:hypothetical protein
MDEVVIPARGPDRDGVFSVLWSTAEPSSSLSHLYLALSAKDPWRLVESGLDRLFTLIDALRERSSHLPELMADIDLDLEPLVAEAGDLVLRHDGDLFAFLGNQPLSATEACLQCRGFDIGYLSHAIDLVSAAPHGVWKLRKRIASGKQHFDDTIAEDWKRWSPVLTRDYLAMVDDDIPSADARAFLDAFPFVRKSVD